MGVCTGRAARRPGRGRRAATTRSNCRDSDLPQLRGHRCFGEDPR